MLRVVSRPYAGKHASRETEGERKKGDREKER